MSFEIRTTPRFDKDVKKLKKRFPKIKEDLVALIEQLRANPQSGVPLGENIYKIRIPNSSIRTGKSGGFRAVTYYKIDDCLYLITLYSKTDQSTISTDTLKAIVKEFGL